MIVLEGQEEDNGDISMAVSSLRVVTFISIIAVIIVFVRKMKLQFR